MVKESFLPMCMYAGVLSGLARSGWGNLHHCQGLGWYVPPRQARRQLAPRPQTQVCQKMTNYKQETVANNSVEEVTCQWLHSTQVTVLVPWPWCALTALCKWIMHTDSIFSFANDTIGVCVCYTQYDTQTNTQQQTQTTSCSQSCIKYLHWVWYTTVIKYSNFNWLMCFRNMCFA